MRKVSRSASISVYGLVALAMLASVALVWQPKALFAEGKTDKEQIQGTWTAVMPSYDKSATAPVRTVSIAFDGEKVYHVKDSKRLDPATFKLDPSKSPKEIDITPDSGEDAGRVVKGIYELNGDQLKITFGEKDRPTDFKGEETMTFTRAK